MGYLIPETKYILYIFYYLKSCSFPITTIPLLTQNKFNDNTTKTSMATLESNMAIS